ncbi:uncharacterized protein LY89DRAFT_715133 [Mollisia scopiformis]|uniref:Uncharacterized protein n=1 Tax=Mollisia scopiformis TaxID=149040 RepID=A0A194XPH9_MOLSC|nr:uncharacterized protein LY89DRAFT_715133 [Mollisia scopiformis]KUJ22155.1 hypothetical protein LY89DRAFT_715133 [Mollisia scopiformis]
MQEYTSSRIPMLLVDIAVGCFVALLVMLLSAIIFIIIPFRKFYGLPKPRLDFDESKNLLPIEEKRRDEPAFSTLALFRSSDLSLDKAKEQYDANPVTYARELWRISIQLQRVLLDKNEKGLSCLLQKQSHDAKRRNRASEGATGLWIRISLFESLEWAIADFRIKRCEKAMAVANRKASAGASTTNTNRLAVSMDGDVELGTIPPTTTNTPVRIDWISEYQTFALNVNLFCDTVSVHAIDHLSPAWDTLTDLYNSAAKRRPDISLVKENQELRGQVQSSKRAIAALQIRRAIDKLTFELPKTAHYSYGVPKKIPKKVAAGYVPADDGAGRVTQRWGKLWGDIWDAAETDEKSLFYKSRQDAKGQHEKQNLKKKGEELFSDMSAEIHGYNKRDQDYAQFDPATNAIAKILLKSLVVDEDSGEVDWKETIRKYPVVGREKREDGSSL